MAIAIVEEMAVIGGLVAVQAIYSIYNVVLKSVLQHGVSALFLVICCNLLASFVLLPFAFAFERRKWPKKFTPSIFAHVFLIALGGITTFQTLNCYGIKKTTPAIASAMPNLAPGFIFVIAACFRFEKFDMSCKYSRVKILGTLACLAGVVAMSLMQSPQSSIVTNDNLLQKVGFGTNNEWMTGCVYLLAAVVTFSCSTVLQAVFLKEFPVPITLCVTISFLGAILTALVQIMVEGKVVVGSTAVDLTTIVGVVLLATAIVTICVSFQTWCISKKGPVFVSLFNPIQTVCSAPLSMIILGETISFGSLIGMFLMFSGLYIVLWAKKKETCIADDSITSISGDIEKPLLS